ncbi:MAG: HDIG domain-containing protein [Chloroflexales bacterium]|nr:HDIG domain-containing protein [Chloroflexales bacterium]
MNSKLRMVLILEGLLLMLGLWAALTLRLPNVSGFLEGLPEVGIPSPVSIRAPNSVEYTSEIRTNELRDRAEREPANYVYTTDSTIPTQQRALLEDLMVAINNVRAGPVLSDTQKEEELITILETSLPSADAPVLAKAIVGFDDAAWTSVQNQTLSLYDQSLSQYNYELDEDAIGQLTQKSLPYWVGTRRFLLPEQRSLILALTTSFLRVNRTLDEEATAIRQREARAAVEPYTVKVLEGENIVRVGELVTQEIIEKLEATGALPKSLSWFGIAGRGLTASLFALIFMFYLVFFHPNLVRQTRSLLVIVIILVITAITARLLLPLRPDWQYAFPLATIALVLTVVFNGRLALSSMVLLCVVLGLVESISMPLVVTLLLGGTVATFMMRSADRLKMFLLAGASVAATTTVAQLAFWLDSLTMVNLNDILMPLLTMLLLGIANGTLSVVLALGLFNMIGRIAGVVTPLQLMELAHPAQPLLRKLIHEAPGTYYHSVAVGNLAEAAADSIGADSLLLRVAAYYHDIGKTIRPYFFSDNQLGRENVHNDLDPITSAQIIVDHVREGVKMAQTAHLPQPIIDFISTHHGTHLIKHFYQVAMQEEDSVDINDFRYPGPKPSTREEGILMLADSVEATVRAKAQNGKLRAASSHENGRSDNGAQTIDELVGCIIDERVRDGQLDETPLTLRDLITIRQVFVNNLQSIYHPRVDYAPQIVRS